MLEVSLFGVETVRRLERDLWSTAKSQRQATNGQMGTPHHCPPEPTRPPTNPPTYPPIHPPTYPRTHTPTHPPTLP